MVRNLVSSLFDQDLQAQFVQNRLIETRDWKTIGFIGLFLVIFNMRMRFTQTVDATTGTVADARGKTLEFMDKTKLESSAKLRIHCKLSMFFFDPLPADFILPGGYLFGQPRILRCE